MSDRSLLEQLYQSIGVNPHDLWGRLDVARIEIHANRVLGVHLVPGLEVEAESRAEGIAASIAVRPGARLEHPVQICFGMIPDDGVQQIELQIEIGADARAGVVAHCTFPNARNIRHEMNAALEIGPGAEYAYFERHVHGAEGGVLVVPKSKVVVREGGRYQTDFELIKGRVGRIEIDVEATVEAHATADISARVSGRGDDAITIREAAHLVGDHARSVLSTSIAVRDRATAEVLNTLTATAAFARGHVDCKEIVQGEASARAVPTVDVRHPRAHVTHEAAIGSVDAKQLETLMSRGLNEEEAVDWIIEGLLGGKRQRLD